MPQQCELRSLASLFLILLSIATGEEQTQSSVVEGPGSRPHMGFESQSNNTTKSELSEKLVGPHEDLRCFACKGREAIKVQVF